MRKNSKLSTTYFCCLFQAQLANVIIGYRSVTASSEWSSNTGPHKAVDNKFGITGNLYHSGPSDYSPWIQIEFIKVYGIKRVVIYNRQGGGCQDTSCGKI
jgi:hypothetical protein